MYKECDKKNCSAKTYSYRDMCFVCKPKETGGRKSKGRRKSFHIKLNEKQQIMLQSYYSGSAQGMVDEILDYVNKPLTKIG